MIWIWAETFISPQCTKWQCCFFFYSETHIYKGQKKRLCHIWSPWFRARHIVFLRYTYLPNLMILEQVVFSLRVGQDFSIFGHIIFNTRRSQWPDSKVRHTIYPRCTSWQSLMTLSMIVFKLWSGHKADRQTDGQTDGHARHTIIRPVIDGHIKKKKKTSSEFQFLINCPSSI
jgi:hypothetical protein